MPPQSKIISTMLRSGTFSEILPASGAATTYTFAPTENQLVHVERCIPFIQDTGGFYASRYGGMAAALTAGIVMAVYGTVDGVDDTVLYNLTDTDYPIKSNADWTSYCYDTSYVSYGQGDNMLVSRWTFAKSGQPVYLDASKNQYIGLSTADTLTDLVAHHVLIQGYYIQQ